MFYCILWYFNCVLCYFYCYFIRCIVCRCCPCLRGSCPFFLPPPSLFFLFSCGLPQEQALALAFFDDSTMLPHPPSRRLFSPNRLAAVWFSFFSLAPALLAIRDTEQVNRAHHTLHVSVLVMCSVLFFVQKMAIVPLLCGTSLHLAQIASDLVGSF